MPKLTIFTSPPPLRALGKIPGKEENVPRESTLTNAFFCPKDGGRLNKGTFPFSSIVNFSAPPRLESQTYAVDKRHATVLLSELLIGIEDLNH
jgi:hypothetical protein